jgi:hypothetical protein
MSRDTSLLRPGCGSWLCNVMAGLDPCLGLTKQTHMAIDRWSCLTGARNLSAARCDKLDQIKMVDRKEIDITIKLLMMVIVGQLWMPHKSSAARSSAEAIALSRSRRSPSPPPPLPPLPFLCVHPYACIHLRYLRASCRHLIRAPPHAHRHVRGWLRQAAPSAAHKMGVACALAMKCMSTSSRATG